MVITLIGYRGSGKTSVASRLAARLGWDYCDADDEIERRANKSIRALFADEGEPAFRALEKQVLAELLARDRLVIAAGGGAILDDATRGLMRNAGPVVWLEASVDSLWERICADHATAERRPPLSARSGKDEVEQLLARREPLYRQTATLTVCTDGLPVDAVAEAVYRHVAARVAAREAP